MGLMGDGQDEDRKLIAEVVIQQMEVCWMCLKLTLIANWLDV